MSMQDRNPAQAQTDAMQQLALLRFERLPSAYAHPERLGACFPPGLPVELREKLLNSKRLQRRLSNHLRQHFDLRPCIAEDLATPEGRFVQLEGEALRAAIRQIGAIYHARTIAAIILAGPLKELIDWLGRDVYRKALRHAVLAPIGTDGDITGGQAQIEQLCRQIERDGQRCIEAWCRKLPASLGNRLLLKLLPAPADGDGDVDPFSEQGLAIVDRVMREMGDGIGS